MRKALVLLLCALLGASAAPRPTDTTKPGTLLSSSSAGSYSPAAITRAGAALYRHVNPPRPRYAVRRYELKVRSTDERGQPITVRAQLFIPQLPRAAKLPVYVLGPGTTGLDDACSVFNEQPERESWGWYQGHMLSYAAQGFIGVMPDYANFDDPDRLQPYFISASEARILLDAARAAYRFFEVHGEEFQARPAQAVFFSGYSQGGHSSFAAADHARRYAPDVPVRGLAVFGATTNVQTLFRENAAFAPYAVAAYEQYYGPEKANARQILRPEVHGSLNVNAKKRCIADLYSMYRKRPEDVFQPAFARALRENRVGQTFPEWASVLKRNDAGNVRDGAGIPAFIAQGTTDDIITEASARAFAKKQCRLGRSVTYKTYQGVNHYQTRQHAVQDAMNWMKRVAAGKNVPNSCR